MVKILYLAAYLTSRYDHHRRMQHTDSDFSYIEKYYESIMKLGLKSVIIIDNPTEANIEFINRYTNNNVSFYIPKPVDRDMHIHDLRFFYFYEYILSRSDIEYVMMTDISDVVILNPIEDIIDIHTKLLCIGIENDEIENNQWFNKTYGKITKIQGNYPICDYDVLFENKTLLNCGSIFGHRDLLSVFLMKTIMIMVSIYDYDYKLCKGTKKYDHIFGNVFCEDTNNTDDIIMNRYSVRHVFTSFRNTNAICNNIKENIKENIKDNNKENKTENVINKKPGDVEAPIDMFVVNYVAYKYYYDSLYKGNLFVTNFSREEYDYTKCVKHK